jgi:hypothetical protein
VGCGGLTAILLRHCDPLPLQEGEAGSRRASECRRGEPHPTKVSSVLMKISSDKHI